MTAWLWTANPDRWKVREGMTGHEAMRRYLEFGNVYWATPKNQARVKVGDDAYIWRSKSSYDARNGIVAVGAVTEGPREYNGDNKQEFEHPDQLESAGWDEKSATSRWKTGIRIRHNFWTRSEYVPGLMVRETVNLLNDEQHRRVEALLAAR